jgi:hypothetical protein
VSARAPEVLGGLAVRQSESTSRWEVLHADSGMSAIGAGLRQRRFAEQARAELLATGVDFSQSVKRIQEQREVWGPVYWLWRKRAESTEIDLVTGEYYNWHVNYGQVVPSAAQAARIAEAMSCFCWS